MKKYIVLIVAILLSVRCIPVNAINIRDNSTVTQVTSIYEEDGNLTIPSVEEDFMKDTNVLVVNSVPDMVDNSQPIHIQLQHQNTEMYTYSGEGIAIREGEDADVQFSLLPDKEWGSLNISATYEDGSTGTQTVYAYRTSNITFTSLFTLDDAFHKAMKYCCSQGLLSESDATQKYTSFIENYLHVFALDSSGKDIVTTSNTLSSTSNTIAIGGELYWAPSSDAVLPLRHIKVSLFEYYNNVYREVSFTYADNNGCFNFTISLDDLVFYNTGGDLLLRFYPFTDTIRLANSDIHYYTFQLPDYATEGNDYYFGYLIDHAEELSAYRLLYIAQGMQIGVNFAESMGVDFGTDLLSVEYTYGSSQSGTWYGLARIGEDHYKNMDVLIHEFGHFVQQSQGFYGSNLFDIIINWPTHSLTEDQAENNFSKEYASELVWSESWASVFSLIAQYTYRDEYAGIPDFADSNFQRAPYENPNIGPNSGEFQELAVMAFLWDLYDNANITGVNEGHDNISLSAQTWWRFTAQEGLYTLSDFMNAIEETYPTYLDEIGAIMATYQISPGQLSITNSESVSSSVAPIVRFRRNGSINNPNTIFQVTIYDAYNNCLATCEQLYDIDVGYAEYIEFQIPLDTWKQVLKYYTGTFEIKIAVKAWHSSLGYMTGPYVSNFISLNFNTSNSTEVILYGTTRYYEKSIKLDKGQYHDFNITFKTGGQKIIQTFGKKDTKIYLYSADGVLLASNDDSGYSTNAFIVYDVEPNTQYKIRVQFYSSNIYGTTKLAIFAAKKLQADVTQSLTRYEDFFCFKNTSNHTMNGYIEKNYCVAFTFQPQVTGTYTFNINSQCDTYLYVIDPRSSDTLVIHIGYDDDSGEGLNPMLTRTLEAGVPYLVIFSAYNPSSLTDTADVSIHFSSN